MKQIVTTGLALLGLIALGATALADEHRRCKGSPTIVEECFVAHGRIIVTNGIPYRLWVIGTRRVLALDEVPREVDDLLALGEKEGKPMSISVFGDYEVCPLEIDRPGWMRAVCIESASHLVATNSEGKVVRK
jgi:hypothetical protein